MDGELAAIQGLVNRLREVRGHGRDHPRDDAESFVEHSVRGEGRLEHYAGRIATSPIRSSTSNTPTTGAGKGT